MKYLFGLFFGILLLTSPPWAVAESDAKDIRINITSMWAAVERDDVENYLNYAHPNSVGD